MFLEKLLLKAALGVSSIKPPAGAGYISKRDPTSGEDASVAPEADSGSSAGSGISKTSADRSSTLALAGVALLTSVVALASYFHRGAILLYGDAVAHINIARRVFDSRTPGPFQLGTVWLPLPHVLAMPFVANDWLWQTGLGASIPSMLAYVAGTLGVFRLVRGLASRGAAWIAALIFALNPNLLYLQATAMTESLYLALFVWTVVFFSEFAQAIGAEPEMAMKSLRSCALTLSAVMLVRYDAWFLAAVIIPATALIVKIHMPGRGGLLQAQGGPGAARGIVRLAFESAVLLSVTAGLWLAYNHAHWGNALEFANGPYSAHAIQQQTRTPTMPSYPGENSPRTATLYFLKLTRLNLGAGLAENLLLTTAFITLLCLVYFSRRFLPWILLWAPLPFYVVCIAWGSIPIYLPDWWPYSYYNVRYGLQMLPAVAVFVALAYEFVRKFAPTRMVVIAIAVTVAASYISIWRQTPICLREAQINGSARLEFDQQLGAELKRLSPQSTLMMSCGAHSGAVQASGIPFRRVLRESNPPYWEIALTEPGRSADYVVGIEGDDVDRAVRLFPEGLQPVATVGAPGGPRGVLYRSTHH